jgi:hypothetical protein
LEFNRSGSQAYRVGLLNATDDRNRQRIQDNRAEVHKSVKQTTLDAEARV